MFKLTLAMTHPRSRETLSQLVEAFTFQALVNHVKAVIARRAARTALQGLSEEQLKDIGLTPSMIEAALRQPVRRFHGDY